MRTNYLTEFPKFLTFFLQILEKNTGAVVQTCAYCWDVCFLVLKKTKSSIKIDL